MTFPTEDTQMAREFSAGQRFAVGVSSLCGIALAGYGAAGSYESIAGLAEQKGVPLPELVPAGIDGGLIGVILLDLTLTWTGQPIAWLRQLVRLLAAGTIAANAAAGWPDPLSIGLHTAAPLMLLAMVEAARTVLRRHIHGIDGRLREPIPLARWLLTPWSTWLLWRRMVLWQVTSYREALDAEQRIRHASMLLRAWYGPRWKRQAPADLVWMLRSGVYADQACASILSGTAPAPGVEASSDSLVPPSQASHNAPESSASPQSAPQAASGCSSPSGSERRIRIDPDLVAEARRIDARHLAEHDRHASAATLRKVLRIGGPEANQLMKIVRGRAPDPTREAVSPRVRLVGAP